MSDLPVSFSPQGIPETVLDPEPPDALRALHVALAGPDADRRNAVSQVVARWPRFLDGCFLRSTITPTDTTMKANNVPMLERSENQLMSKIPAGIPTRRPATQVLT